ncbi:hypothetical protein H257_19202 [Aphanomyces astaci]|uniref:Uncharacterized protein n=1 Tax=Aphanomyces astaci TaxID=112090 RepID=W4FAB4_APHAT|nr:hypothetical protein H257_19202 [Aphanomyces astaci]ETV63864.1 hypothetical protein H257_19202 [Aphanomyces astaci]|eukprot:XP_009846657.1 hypothetical protein H257_19202 [Aphanomyces astaci]
MSKKYPSFSRFRKDVKDLFFYFCCAAVVHAAAAASQVEVDRLTVVFDSLAPLDAGATGSHISKDRGVAVQFPSFPASEAACGPAGRTLEYVNFTLNTLNIPTDESLWLQAALCPSANGLPNCVKSDTPARITIETFDRRVKFQWFPAVPIVLEPATTYWFTVLSNGETKDKFPIWLDGTKEFSTANDPRNEVLVAYTEKEGGPWDVLVRDDGNRLVPSFEVYAS